MREQPWHIRRPHTGHYQRFKNILDLHMITRGWLKDLGRSALQLTSALPRVSAPGVEENLWMLEKLSTEYSAGDLEKILDESTPEESLSRFHRTVSVTQSWILRSIREKTPPEEQAALTHLLEQSSWISGRHSATERWKGFPNEARHDVRVIVATLGTGPFANSPQADGFLVKRATEECAELEFLSCPHQSPYSEARPAADQLCSLYSHWMRGYVYALNTLVLTSYRRAETPGDHCLLRLDRATLPQAHLPPRFQG